MVPWRSIYPVDDRIFLTREKMENSMSRQILTISFLLAAVTLSAQTENKAIVNGNKLYKEGKFEEAIVEYRKAAESNPANSTIPFNLGNAIFKKDGFEEALDAYNKSIELSKDNTSREMNTYNKGVVYSKQKKLNESIVEYKNALKIDPNDAEARHNLQKALFEQRKQNQPNEKQDQQKKQQQQQQQQKDQQKKQQQQKPQSNFNRKQVEQLMKALRQKEQDIQQKMQQSRSRGTSQPDKDW
ncbi:MAG: tetratricopeptide repeat protein [Chitinophagaceae bacterium]|nr:MAG: tetratricopeptide repeat protein [Chitinophagaceae bacterium]